MLILFNSFLVTEEGHAINEEWVQKAPRKALHIVVMVSQQEIMYPMRTNIARTMSKLHKLLQNDTYKPLYSLIGFGGAGIHEVAHIHPLQKGHIRDLTREIKLSMSYKGKGDTTNDAYHAILLASQLKFKQGVEKVFIMFNSEPHTSHEGGPSFDETRYILQDEANAPLFVFDAINFPNYGIQATQIIGQTERKLYTMQNVQGITNKHLDLPASEFKTLVLQSEGGLFSNNIKRPQRVGVSLHDAVSNWVKKDIAICKRCVLRSSWTGESRAICVSDSSTIEC